MIEWASNIELETTRIQILTNVIPLQIKLLLNLKSNQK